MPPARRMEANPQGYSKREKNLRTRLITQRNFIRLGERLFTVPIPEQAKRGSARRSITLSPENSLAERGAGGSYLDPIGIMA